jgi:hypothetical protein
MTGLLEPTIKETYQAGRASNTFRFEGWYVRAAVSDGPIARLRSRLLRQRGDLQKQIGSLKRFKDDASEVRWRNAFRSPNISISRWAT